MALSGHGGALASPPASAVTSPMASAATSPMASKVTPPAADSDVRLDKQGGGRFLGGGNNPRRSVSDATAQAIDREVRGLVDRAHDRALAILRHNRELLDSISHKILEKEVIEGDELKDLLASSILPAEANLQPVAA
jgi:ATP-dependent Zn protease